MRVRPREASLLNNARLPQPGEYTQPVRPYIRGASGAVRPDGAATYVVDGIEHRFDGKCHDECENVR